MSPKVTGPLIGICALAFSDVVSAQETFQLPTANQRQAIIMELGKEMDRLDGDGLPVREGRSLTWRQVTDVLSADAHNADSAFKFAHVLTRLDAAYPNLHSRVEFGAALQAALPQDSARPEARFDIAESGTETPTFVISQVSSTFPKPGKPQRGDIVIAINDKPISDWIDENFNFCEWPLRTQCDSELFVSLANERLHWHREMPLSYTLRRDQHEWTVQVPVSPRPPRQPRDPREAECGTYADRYPGFQLTYTGNRVCIYESSAHDSLAVMRITSFNYGALRDDQPIRSLDEEIEALRPWWTAHATWANLIVDVIDNGGGQSPIGYYQLLFRSPFQEQYVRFKKTPEIEDSTLRRSLFWGSDGQEIWYQRIISEGIYARLPYGGFLPPVPMFCPSESRACDDGLFQPFDHPFVGSVQLLTSRYCVSSCDGFVYALKENLSGRIKLYGEHQAADSAFSRLTIDVVKDDSRFEGFRLQVRPIRITPTSGTIFSQTVAVTRSVTKDGVPVGGVPVSIDSYVPEEALDATPWVQKVFERALLELR